MTNPSLAWNDRNLWNWFCLSAFGRAGALLGLFDWRGRNLAQCAPEGVAGVVGLRLARCFNEALALGLAVVGLLGLCHGLSLADLLACRDVRHG